MKKMHPIFMLAIITLSFSAHADLPSVRNQYNQPYNNQFNGNTTGYNQFNYPNPYGSGSTGYGYGTTQGQQQQTMAMQQQASGQKMQKMYNTYMTGKDLLWLFTADDSTFGKRLFYIFSGALDRKFIQPIENSIGSFEQNRQLGVTPTVARQQRPSAQPQPCYDCIQQNSTNPNAQNPNALNPALFNGSNQGPLNQGGSGQIGGIQH